MAATSLSPGTFSGSLSGAFSAPSVPRIAVLLAAYNGMAWLQQQVQSILAQQGVRVALFISVDASTGGTRAWVQALSQAEPAVTLLPDAGRLGSAGANFFHLLCQVDCATFDAVAFADQDDIWLPDKLQRAWQRLASGACAVYSSNVLAVWDDGRSQLIDKAQPQKTLDYFFEAAGPGCTYVLGASAMAQLQPWVRANAHALRAVDLHDWLVYAYCRTQGLRWYIDPVPSMHYRQHASNQVGINAGLSAYRKRWALLRSHWFRRQVLAIARLVAPQQAACLQQRWFLIRNFYQLRRRRRDAWLLLGLLLLGIY